jgi:cystathionine beta-synthase
MSKIFNDDWMIANGFLPEGVRGPTVGDVLRAKEPLPPLITVEEHAVVKEALDLLREYEISQLPVMRDHEVIGSINDVAVMQAVFDHADILHKEVREVMGRAFPTLDAGARIDAAYKLLTLANSAIVATENGKAIGVITRQDIISFLSSNA